MRFSLLGPSRGAKQLLLQRLQFRKEFQLVPVQLVRE
ncbi:hypothetical protein CEXT_30051, partial [Caerostris extrusa]